MDIPIDGQTVHLLGDVLSKITGHNWKTYSPHPRPQISEPDPDS